jgi:hypothetical protein
MGEKEYYFITYKMESKRCVNNYIYNHVITINPIIWLKEKLKNFTENRYTLISYYKITENEYNELCNML